MKTLQKKEGLKPGAKHAPPWHQDPAMWHDAASAAVLHAEEDWQGSQNPRGAHSRSRS